MEGRKFVTTNLAPNMIILQSIGKSSFRHVPVDIKELAGQKLFDSLNNSGVRGWLERNGVFVINETEDGRPHKFSLRDGDILYLVVDEPGEKNLNNKLASFKDSTDLPEIIKPVIIKIEGRGDLEMCTVEELIKRLQMRPANEMINPNWLDIGLL